MKKHSLDIEEIVVESFAVLPGEGRGEGTVYAYLVTEGEECGGDSPTCKPGPGSCADTCGPTCPPTCEYSCPWTCEDTPCPTYPSGPCCEA